MQPLETNTLIFTNLSEQTFQDNGKLLLKWLPVKPQQLVLLSSFGRILCVFARTVDAREIKKRHKQILDGCSIGIYYGLPYAEPGPERYLQVPELQRNFLLSPPGSPPVGWVQTHEKPPISEDEIASAFSHVSLADFTLDGGRLVDLDQDPGIRQEIEEPAPIDAVLSASVPEFQFDLLEEPKQRSFPKTRIPEGGMKV